MHQRLCALLTAVGISTVLAGCRGPDVSGVPTVPTSPPNRGLACGVERWFVKTLADADAASVRTTDVTTLSISELAGFPAHCDGGPDRRTYPEEFRVFEVVGRITFVAREDDRDYHIALEDPDRPASTVVTEIADTVCQGAAMSPHLSTLMGARLMFEMLLAGRAPSALVGQTVRVRGVGFFDFDHGQRGRSANCIELHPVLFIERAD